MIRHFKSAYGLTANKIKLPLFLYALSSAFALGAAAFFYKIVFSAADGSLAVNKLLADFNYMVYSDFVRLHGNKFRSLFLIILLFGVVFFIFNAFLTGGIFGELKSNEKFSFKTFLRVGFSTFGSYLLLAVIQVIVLTITLLISGILFTVAFMAADGGNERDYFFWSLPPLILTLFILSIVVVIFDYARCLLFENRRFNAFEDFGKGFRYIFKYFSTVGFYWIIIGLHILVGLTYLLFDAVLGMSSVLTVVLMFVFQQAVVFARSFLRVMNFAVIQNFYRENPLPQPPIVLPHAAEFDENKPLDEE